MSRVAVKEGFGGTSMRSVRRWSLLAKPTTRRISGRRWCMGTAQPLAGSQVMMAEGPHQVQPPVIEAPAGWVVDRLRVRPGLGGDRDVLA